ncbi:hypothetical protein IAU60_003591 [Kwoniella sp. DSM 27419]
MLAALADLPSELLQDIHMQAQNPFFHQTSRNIYHALHRPSAYYAAQYLLSLYSHYGSNEMLVRSLRHPVCNVQVAQEIRRVWYDRYNRQACVEPAPEAETMDGVSASMPTVPRVTPRSRSRSRSRSASSPTRQLRPTIPPLTCTELPRRLFRDPAPSDRPIHPLITYLFTTYSPSANSHKGYPLFRAVLTSNYDLVTYLLSHGADPGIKDCFALDIAITKKDLRMVKLLVERDPAGLPPTPSPVKTNPIKGKKAKLTDRVEIGTKLVEKAFQKGSKDIINYFVYEKKALPPLQSIMKMGKADRPKVSPAARRSRPTHKSSPRP